ncbi:MAG: M24 family metallopeptidase, partial [candidate division WOR-3 bacterium]
MKKDIDRLMKKMKVDVIYAESHAGRDTNMFYLLNGANIFAHYIKKRGKPAFVVHTPIEREVAQETGHRLINMNQYDRRRLQEKYRDLRKANAHFVSMLFKDLGVKGQVAFYGNFPLGEGFNYIKQIQRINRNIKVYKGDGRGIIAEARKTKDEDEIARIRKVRNAVVHAFDTMLKSVRRCRVKGDGFVTEGKRKLLIGDLRLILRRELFARGIIDSAGMIVAQGRDAGVPHNSGRDRQQVKLGKPIVFDIFPQEIGGGYFFDFTRTVCFGHAPKPLHRLYQTVVDSHEYASGLLKVGQRTRDVEQRVCEFFEEHGHRTFLSDPKNQTGYCHSLGHGVGLNVHESPFFNLVKTNNARIEPGMVFTI